METEIEIKQLRNQKQVHSNFMKKSIKLDGYGKILDFIMMDFFFIVLTQNELLIVLNQNKGVSVKEMFIPFKPNKLSQLLPCESQYSFVVWSSDYFFFNCYRLFENSFTQKLMQLQKAQQKIEQLQVVKYNRRSKPYNKYFHQSGLIVQLSEYEAGDLWFLNMEYLSLTKYSGMGNSSSIIIKNIEETQNTFNIYFFDINLRQQKQIKLDKSVFDIQISPHRLYVIGQRILLAGGLSGETLTIFKIQCNQKSTQKILELQQIQHCVFFSVNIESGLLLIKIKRRQQNAQKMLLISFKHKQIISEFCKANVIQNSSKRWSRDFHHYIEINKSEVNSLTYYKTPQQKKVYYHLLRKSELLTIFGEGIVLPLFKCIQQ